MQTKYRCPKCKSVKLAVVVEAEALLIQEPDNYQTTDLDGSHHSWDDQSFMRCLDCGRRSVAANFTYSEVD